MRDARKEQDAVLDVGDSISSSMNARQHIRKSSGIGIATSKSGRYCKTSDQINLSLDDIMPGSNMKAKTQQGFFQSQPPASYLWYGLDETQQQQFNTLLNTCMDNFLEGRDSWMKMLNNAKHVLEWAKSQYLLVAFKKSCSEVREVAERRVNRHNADNYEASKSRDLSSVSDVVEDEDRCQDILPFAPSKANRKNIKPEKTLPKLNGTAMPSSTPKLFSSSVIYDDYVTDVKSQIYTLPLTTPIPHSRCYTGLKKSIKRLPRDSFVAGHKQGDLAGWHFAGSELPLSGPAMRIIWLLHQAIQLRGETQRQQLEPMLWYFFNQLWRMTMKSLPDYLRTIPPSVVSVLRVLRKHFEFEKSKRYSMGNLAWSKTSEGRNFDRSRESVLKEKPMKRDVFNAVNLYEYTVLPYRKLWCRQCHCYNCSLHGRGLPRTENGNEPLGHALWMSVGTKKETSETYAIDNITGHERLALDSAASAAVESLAQCDSEIADAASGKTGTFPDRSIDSCFGLAIVAKTVNVVDHDMQTASRVLALEQAHPITKFSEFIRQQTKSARDQYQSKRRSDADASTTSKTGVQEFGNIQTTNSHSVLRNSEYANRSEDSKEDTQNREESNPEPDMRGKLVGKKRKWSRRAGAPLEGVGVVDMTKRRQYTPCNHEGPCTKANAQRCSCIQLGNLCEKYCACGSRCHGNRFEGCRCVTGCQPSTCPCALAGRECDPDLCTQCLSRDPATNLRMIKNEKIDVRGSSLNSCNNSQVAVCYNMPLQLGISAKVKVGRSKTHGWGCFTLEDLPKGVHIMEYVGEVIDGGTADMRGVQYDGEGTSFLFDLNADQVLDAMKFGSRSKFMNHSSEPNVIVRSILVNGQNRISMRSRRRIVAGEELVFDYGYEADVAPLWAK